MLSNRLLFYVKPTEQCNTQCLHCYNANRSSEKLNINSYRRFMDSVASYLTDQQIEVILHGGEPTLVGCDALERIMNESRAALPFADLKFSIQSNMLDCSDDLFCLVNAYMGGIIGTSYSPYMRFTDIGEYNRWLDNLRAAVANSVKPYLIITLSKQYIDTVRPRVLLDFLISEKIWGFHFEPLTDDGFASERWLDIKPDCKAYDLWKTEFANLFISQQAYKQIEKSDIIGKARVFVDGGFTGCCSRNCYMSVFTINSNGTIGGCPNKSNTEVFGTLNDDFNKILNSPVRRQAIVKEKARRDECLSCDLFKYCNGGCVQADECTEGRNFYQLLHDRFVLDPEYRKYVIAAVREPVCV